MSAEREYERSSLNVQLLRRRKAVVFDVLHAGNLVLLQLSRIVCMKQTATKSAFFWCFSVARYRKAHRFLLRKRDTFALFFLTQKEKELKRKTFFRNFDKVEETYFISVSRAFLIRARRALK